MREFTNDALVALAREWHTETGSLFDDPRNTIPDLCAEILKLRAQAVYCRECKAAPGEQCSGPPDGYSHTARTKAAGVSILIRDGDPR